MKNCILAAVLACLAVPAYGQQTRNQELGAALLSEAPDALAEYENRFTFVQGLVRFSRTNRGNWQEGTTVLERNNDCTLKEIVEVKCEQGSPTEKIPLMLTVTNARYGFLLERPQSGGPWALKHVAKPGIGEDFGVYFDTAHNQVNPSYLMRNRLSEVIRDPGFKLRSIVEDSEGNCRCEFQIDAATTRLAATTRIVSGTVVLDPRHMWCLVSGDLEMYLSEGRLGRATCSFEYAAGSTDARFSVPRKTQRDIYINNEIVDSMTLTLELAIPEPLPDDSRFTLTAFGFPEPDWAEPPQTTSWTISLVIAAAGVALVVIGAFIVKNYQRARS